MEAVTLASSSKPNWLAWPGKLLVANAGEAIELAWEPSTPQVAAGMVREILHRLAIAQDTRALSLDEQWLRRKLKQHSLGDVP